MIQAGVIDHLENRMDGSSLWVVGTIHQAAEASMHGRSRAHRARLNCSKQFAVAEPMIPQASSRLAQGHDFGMCGGVVIAEVAIPSPSYDASFAHHDGSNRHLACLQCALRAAKGFFHPKFVGRHLVERTFVR
jgi:hypothetical protein